MELDARHGKRRTHCCRTTLCPGRWPGEIQGTHQALREVPVEPRCPGAALVPLLWCCWVRSPYITPFRDNSQNSETDKIRLTLTAASRVYLMEPQWNPALEEQALARIHRIGQMQPVTTIRFVVEKTIEEVTMLTLARQQVNDSTY